jgi:hypothetical protein
LALGAGMLYADRLMPKDCERVDDARARNLVQRSVTSREFDALAAIKLGRKTGVFAKVPVGPLVYLPDPPSPN